MSWGFQTDVDTLVEHAGVMRNLAARLDTTTEAACAPFAPDSYGLLCGFLSALTSEAERRTGAAIAQLARVSYLHAEGINDCASGYQQLERALATWFGVR